MKRPLALLLMFLALGIVPARAEGDAELRRRIETLERELEKERERAATERKAQEERLRTLEAQIEELRSVGAAAPPAPSPSPPMARIPGILNPAISAIGNFVFRGSDRKMLSEGGDRIDNRPNLRETELDIRTAVDPYADAVLIASVESEAPGRFDVGVEEGYLNLKKLPFLELPPLGLKLKLGRFRPAFGRINILHTHDLPQTTRPLVIEELLGPEGFVEDGVSGQFFVPTPWDEESSIDVTLQALSGDLATAPGGRNDAGFLGHLRWFRTFANVHDLELGWSSNYSRNTNPALHTWLHGADALYRWKPLRGGEWQSFLLGGEYLFADRQLEDASGPALLPTRRTSRPEGFYLFAQEQPAQRWYLGVRGDSTDTAEDARLHRRGIMPYVSYYFSEFLRFRLGYEHLWSDRPEEDGRNSVLLEANWVFGSHPPEPFWVQK